MMHVLAIDPGKATGIAVVVYDKSVGALVRAWSDELDFAQVVARVKTTLELRPDVPVVMEKFTITAQTAKNTQATWSLEVIGAVRALLVLAGRDPDEVILQTPAAAKSFVSNENLRDIDLWHRGGAGHANDALRHAVLYYASQGIVPPSLIASKLPKS